MKADEEDWFTEVCISLRGPREKVSKAYDRLLALARKLPGVEASDHCDVSGPADDYVRDLTDRREQDA